ncbi:GNAT family N-acetyltransferase [Gracilibacillus sp. D59]|uniref:GNAT family N-acetyltransferase n=1 Tax=Gracilibacillus sp. D59 TaxID=3457434 RepID=UPI003FCC7215
MNNAPTISGNKVILRQPIESDIEDYLNIDHNLELIRMYGGNRTKIKTKTRSDAEEFIKKIRSNPLEWCIEFQGRCIGQARLTVHKHDNRARYAVGLFDPSTWGKGIGQEVTKLVLDFAFYKLSLHRVDLRVLEYNKRAIKCYEKCGFTKEGVEREAAFIEGKYETDVMMSILDREHFQS